MVVEWTTIEWLMPEIVLVVMATWIYLGGTLRLRQSRQTWSRVAVFAYILAGLALLLQSAAGGWQVWQELFPNGRRLASGPLALDPLAGIFRWFALLIGLLFTLTVSRTAHRSLSAEFLGTLMLMTVGLMLVAAAKELVFLFVGLELISIPTYVVLFLGRADRASAEAAAKYFFLSIFSSALLLYGFSFLYGIGGSTNLARIYAALAAGPAGAAVLSAIALVLIIAGLGFKIAAVPFHFYAPDVYQGTTNANAGLLAAVPKMAGVIALVRLVPLLLPVTASFAWQLSIALAMFTMTMGNICALWQNDFRRLMAYSSIAHVGYMLMGLAAGLAWTESGGMAALLFYLSVYVLATVAAFAALSYLGSEQREVNGIAELGGLSRTRPLAAGVIAVAMFSLAGIPPLAGFWGKFGLFNSAVILALRGGGQANWFLALAIVGALNAAVAAAYYLRVVSVMYFRPSTSELPAQGGSGALVATCTCAVLVLAVGVLPGQAVRFAELADRAARNRPVISEVHREAEVSDRRRATAWRPQ